MVQSCNNMVAANIGSPLTADIGGFGISNPLNVLRNGILQPNTLQFSGNLAVQSLMSLELFNSTAQLIPNTGTAVIQFDSTQLNNLWGPLTFPLTSLTAPKDGLYMVTYKGVWGNTISGGVFTSNISVMGDSNLYAAYQEKIGASLSVGIVSSTALLKLSAGASFQYIVSQNDAGGGINIGGTSAVITYFSTTIFVQYLGPLQ